jgi:hypothetical protein
MGGLGGLLVDTSQMHIMCIKMSTDGFCVTISLDGGDSTDGGKNVSAPRRIQGRQKAHGSPPLKI